MAILKTMISSRISCTLASVAFACSICLPNFAYAERIKDIASIAGVRTNQLLGYGLVVGLNGTGDSNSFTTQSFINMLKEMGVRLPANMSLSLKNVAAVAINAELPAFAKPGQRIDVTVSSLGNAKSLRGGVLILSPLRGADNHVYAIAQGSLVSSGFGGEGADGSKITVNVPSVARIANGATVERPAPNTFSLGEKIVFNLHRPDFTSAKRLSQTINQHFTPSTARPLDAASVEVRMPVDAPTRVKLVSQIENLELTPGEGPAKIIVNSRTGTIVIGQHVKVYPAAVSHGSLVVTVSEDPYASQPAPFSEGQTRVLPSSQVTIDEENSRAFMFGKTATLNEIVNAINRVGAAPGDLIAILEALKAAGALRGELEVI